MAAADNKPRWERLILRQIVAGKGREDVVDPIARLRMLVLDLYSLPVAVSPRSFRLPVPAEVGNVVEELARPVGCGCGGEREEMSGGAVGGDPDAGDGDWRGLGSGGGLGSCQPRKDHMKSNIVGSET